MREADGAVPGPSVRCSCRKLPEDADATDSKTGIVGQNRRLLGCRLSKGGGVLITEWKNRRIYVSGLPCFEIVGLLATSAHFFETTTSSSLVAREPLVAAVPTQAASENDASNNSVAWLPATTSSPNDSHHSLRSPLLSSGPADCKQAPVGPQELLAPKISLQIGGKTQVVAWLMVEELRF